MLDSDIGRFYHQDANIVSTQTSHNNVPAVAPNMFFTPHNFISDQGNSAEKLLV